MSVLGLTGVLIFCAGICLLWQARAGILYWLEFYFRVFWSELTRRGGLRREEASLRLGDPVAAAGGSRRRNTALLVAGGFGLVVLGQVLFLLDLAL